MKKKNNLEKLSDEKFSKKQLSVNEIAKLHGGMMLTIGETMTEYQCDQQKDIIV